MLAGGSTPERATAAPMMNENPAPDRTTTAAELAELVGGRCEGLGNTVLRGVAALDDAGADQVARVEAGDDAEAVARSRAGALVVGAAITDLRTPQLVAADPSLAFARILRHFHPLRRVATHTIHPSAHIDPSAVIGDPVEIGAMATVEAGARIEAGAMLDAGCVIGAGARIGPGARVHAGVVLYPGAVVGAAAEVHANVVLGCDGFGYTADARGMVKIAHIGDVVLETDTEVCALSTVDRAMLGSTLLLTGTKMGSLSHVAHNSTVGPHASVGSFGGTAGSVTLGEGVVLGQHAIVYDHVKIPAATEVEPVSMVVSSIQEPGRYAGHPLQTSARWAKTFEMLGRLGDLRRLLRANRR